MIVAARLAAGARRYRSRLSVHHAPGATALAVELQEQLIARAPSERIEHAQLDPERADRTTLELQLLSSSQDDYADVDTVNLGQLRGDRAARFWTRPAATLLDTSADALDQLRELTYTARSADSVRAVTVRTWPLGQHGPQPVLADFDRLAPGPYATLYGIPRDRGAQLVAVMREELNTVRWGPAEDLMPSVTFNPVLELVSVAYQPDPATWTDPALDGLLIDFALALVHLRTVLERAGVVGAAAVEARLDRRFPPPPEPHG